jgi:hypothetical protein
MVYLYLLMVVWVVLQVFWPNPSASLWSSCGQWRFLKIYNFLFSKKHYYGDQIRKNEEMGLAWRKLSKSHYYLIKLQMGSLLSRSGTWIRLELDISHEITHHYQTKHDTQSYKNNKWFIKQNEKSLKNVYLENWTMAHLGSTDPTESGWNLSNGFNCLELGTSGDLAR